MNICIYKVRFYVNKYIEETDFKHIEKVDLKIKVFF